MSRVISLIIILLAASTLIVGAVARPTPALSQTPANVTLIPVANLTIGQLQDMVKNKNATGALSALESIVVKIPSDYNESVFPMMCLNCVPKVPPRDSIGPER